LEVDSEVEEDVQQPKDSLNLEGVIIDEEMFLVDKIKKTVFSSADDGSGKLTKVGIWDPETETMKPLGEEPELQVEDEEKGASSHESDSEGTADLDSEDKDKPKETVSGSRRGTIGGAGFPFRVDDDNDHCETSPEAYADVEAILGRLAELMGKSRETLSVYDPFYCTGRAVENLGKFGFENVYNKCEDFYAVVEAGQVPPHDVVVTNPPYSGDHVEEIIRFCCKQAKPWLLLLPNYVYRKDFFEPALRSGARPVMPFYIAPTQRYYYWSPKGLSRSNPKVRGDGRTSPFVSFWYCHLGRYTEDICQWWNKSLRGKEGPGGRRVVLARSTRQLPIGAMDVEDPSRQDRKRKLDRAHLAKKANCRKEKRGRGRSQGQLGRGDRR